MRSVLLLSCLTLLVPCLANAAQVYRCVDENGRVEYRDMPCAGRSGSAISIEPNVTREIDQRAFRAASQALTERAAVRAAAENEAARARSRTAGVIGAAGGAVSSPWWQQGGPPPERDVSPTPPDEGTPDAPKAPPPIATPPTPLPVSPAQPRPVPVRPGPPPAVPPPVMPVR